MARNYMYTPNDYSVNEVANNLGSKKTKKSFHKTILKKCQMIAMMFTYDFSFLFQYSTLQDLEFNFEKRKYNRNQKLPRP